jgi:hypothetical protein
LSFSLLGPSLLDDPRNRARERRSRRGTVAFID